MFILIIKELCDPVNGEIVGPHYHIYRVDEKTKEKEYIKTIDGDIKEAARYAERQLDINVFAIALDEYPMAFSSCISPEQMEQFQPSTPDGWTPIRDGLKMDKDGHIAGGLKFKE